MIYNIVVDTLRLTGNSGGSMKMLPRCLARLLWCVTERWLRYARVLGKYGECPSGHSRQWRLLLEACVRRMCSSNWQKYCPP